MSPTGLAQVSLCMSGMVHSRERGKGGLCLHGFPSQEGGGGTVWHWAQAQTTDHSRGFLQRVHQWEKTFCVRGATWVWVESSDLLIFKETPSCLLSVLGLRAPEEEPWFSSRIPGPALLAAKPSTVTQLCTAPAETVALLFSISMQLHWIKADCSLPVCIEMMSLTAAQKDLVCHAKICTGNLS